MVQVPTFGWWQPSADDLNLYPGRRAELLACCLLVPSDVACADRDRWTVAGRTFEQDGSPHDYNHGPWGMAVPLVVYLSRVEG